MFEAYAGGKSMATVARDLNAWGVGTVRGAAWSQSRVGQTLANPLYRGMVRYGAELFPGRHTPIVSDQLWREVEELRAGASGGGTMPEAGLRGGNIF
jgi:Recombinase